MSLPEMSLDAARWRPHCGCQSEGLRMKAALSCEGLLPRQL